MQTKTQSAIESLVNIAIGYGIAVISQLIIFPYFDIQITVADNLLIGGWFTGVSLARSYGLRRFFNWIHYKEAK